MGEYYTHLLIAVPKQYTPSPSQVQAFLRGVVEEGHLPAPVDISARRYTGKTQTVRNPFGGKAFVIERPEALPIKSLDEAATQIGTTSDYAVRVEGVGSPVHPPFRIGYPEDFKGDYSLTVTCRVSKVLRATSDKDDENPEESELPSFGRPCTDELSVGRYRNPLNGEFFAVPGAGCARFWIEVQLGKFMAPLFPDDRLDVIDTAFLGLAERTFGIRFLQGCMYG